MQEVIELARYQEQKARRQTYSAMEVLYMNLLTRLNEHLDLPHGSHTLERFMADIVADYLLEALPATTPPARLNAAEHLPHWDHALDQLSHRYADFDTQLRQTLYQRISEAQQPEF